MKRILFVTHTLDFRAGGAERVLYDVLGRLDRSRFEPTVAVAESLREPVEVFEALGLRVEVLPSLSLTSSRSARNLLTTAWALLRLHVAVLFLLRRGAFDAVYVNSVFALHFAALPARLFRIPLVYHEHGLALDRGGSVWGRFVPRLLPAVTRVVAITDAVREQIVGIGFPAARAQTVHNGVDLAGGADPTQRERSRSTRAPGHFRAVQIANFLPWKGHETVVRAVSRLRERLPGIQVVFFGQAKNERFDRQLAALIAERAAGVLVEFAGFRADVRDLLPEFDCLILASDREPFGLVLLEAMAAEVPVVASRGGGVPEIVTHEENGLLFEPGDDRDLARQLERLASDPGLRERLVRNGRDTVERRFSLEVQARSIEAVLDAAIADGGGAPAAHG